MLDFIHTMILIYLVIAVNHIIDNQVDDYKEYKKDGIKCKEQTDDN